MIKPTCNVCLASLMTYAESITGMFDRCGHNDLLFMFVILTIHLFNRKCCTKLSHILISQTEQKRTTGHALDPLPYVLKINYLKKDRLQLVLVYFQVTRYYYHHHHHHNHHQSSSTTTTITTTTITILSPLLFNFYINNLPYSFQNALSDPFVLPNGTKINSLLYADDLIILSRSKTGLQNCLNTLSSYCKSWMLKINPKKTKVMIFQKRSKKSVDINFKIDTEPVEIVQEYTYLGTRLTPTGNFTLALDHLKGKAMHAFSNIQKHTLLSKLNPNTASQIFDTMIFSILSYNSEVWGMYTKQEFKTWDNSPLEKVHLKFCKRYLEVNNKASNLACRAELGRYPLLIAINQKL